MAKTQQDQQVGGKRQLIERANSHIFTTVIIASIVVSASAVAISFLWGQRGFQDRVISAQEVTRDTINQNVANAQELERSFIALEESDINSQLILDALPSKYDFPAVASSVEKLADLGGVALDDFSGDDLSAAAENTAIEPIAIEIPFSSTVSGGEKDVEKFINTLEKSIRPFRIDGLSLNSSANNLVLEVSVSTFYQPSENLEVRTETIR